LTRETSEIKKEEIRGLFVLGLLAVLASVRIQYGSMTVTIGQGSFNIAVFFDFTIALWSFYAFFMVFGLSADMLGDTIANMCRDMARLFLQLNFIALAAIGLFLITSAYPTRFPWTMGLIVVAFVLATINRLRTIKTKPLKINYRKSIKNSILPALAIITFISFVLIAMGVNEQLVIPAFVVGCAAMVLFFLVRLKMKGNTQTNL